MYTIKVEYRARILETHVLSTVKQAAAMFVWVLSQHMLGNKPKMVHCCDPEGHMIWLAEV